MALQYPCRGGSRHFLRGVLGDDSPPAGVPCGKFEAEGLTSVEMIIFIQKHVAKFLAKSENEKISLHY